MERASAFGLAQDRAYTGGLEMSASGMMEAVKHFLKNAIALDIMAELGDLQRGPDPGREQFLATEAMGLALGMVASILTRQNEIEKNRAETAYSPSVLDALAQLGLNTPYGRTWVEVNAVVSGRAFDQIALDWANPPEVLLVEKKIEQIKGLAEAGRFDVLDPQFGADAAFLPYTGLWAQVGPEVRAQIADIHAQWAELARYWGATIAGERPAGPPPPDPWGIGEIAMERVEEITAAELAHMKAELEWGTATKESMAAHLERLDQRKEVLGSDRFEALVAEVFGKKAAELQDWLDFREEFRKGKAEYWCLRIVEGKDVADAWDKEFYQPLREKRDQGLQGEYGALVGAIQDEAESLHIAYQRLWDAKTGWWQAYREGQPTREYEQRAAAAREQLAELDPRGAWFWDPERVWAMDREQRDILNQFREAHTAYWDALVHGSETELAAAKAKLKELEIYNISPTIEPIQRIAEAYMPQVEAVYRRNKEAAATAGSPGVLERHVNWNAMLERELGEDWVKRMNGKGAAKEEAREPERSEGLIWRMPLENAVLTTPYGQVDGLHNKGHGGIDLISSNPQVMATAEGQVVFTGIDPQGIYGNMVIVKHGDTGYFSLYGHLDSIGVGVGDTVETGETLGVMGNTGLSQGAHLHLELRRGTWDESKQWNEALPVIENPWLQLETTAFGINFRRLMEDKEFLDTTAATLDDVRKVLGTSPTFADYASGDRLFPVYRRPGDSHPEKHVDVAKLIYDSAIEAGINPKLLLARLQVEQSLLDSYAAPDSRAVVAAMGYAVTDHGTDKSYYGLDYQITFAANLLRDLFKGAPEDLDLGPVVFGGLNDPGSTLEGEGLTRTNSAVLNSNAMGGTIIITEHIGVENRATWALYKYTPHMIDLNLILRDVHTERVQKVTFPDVYEQFDPRVVGGGNKRFVEAWRMVENLLAD